MHKFVILIAVMLGVSFAWLALHNILLRAFGIPTSIRTSEERAARRERILQMGKLRYTLIFGVFGFGFGIGLVTATTGLVLHDFEGWMDAVFNLLYWMAASGWLWGIREWNQSYRGEVPFPPSFPPQK